jgi:hypothetical protein
VSLAGFAQVPPRALPFLPQPKQAALNFMQKPHQNIEHIRRDFQLWLKQQNTKPSWGGPASCRLVVFSAIWRLLPARHEVTRFAITGSCGRQNRRRTLLKSPVMQLLSALKIAEIEL